MKLTARVVCPKGMERSPAMRAEIEMALEDLAHLRQSLPWWQRWLARRHVLIEHPTPDAR